MKSHGFSFNLNLQTILKMESHRENLKIASTGQEAHFAKT